MRRANRAGGRRAHGVHAPRADRLRRDVLQLLHHPDDPRPRRRTPLDRSSRMSNESPARVQSCRYGSPSRIVRPRSHAGVSLLHSFALADVPTMTFRISSLEPMDCTPAIVDVVIARPSAALSSAAAARQRSILVAMRRPYTLAFYAVVNGRRAAPARVHRIRPDRRVSPARPTTTSRQLERYLRRHR